MRYVQIGLGISDCDNKSLYKLADEFVTEALYITNTAHKGTLPLSAQVLTASEGVAVAGIKVAEDDNSLVLRTFSEGGKAVEAVITFEKSVKSAYLTDLNEQPIGKVKIDGNTVSYTLPAYTVQTVKVEL